jgi:2'-5' RNA ligase
VSFREALEGILALPIKEAQVSTGPRKFFVHVRVPEHVAADLRQVQKKVLPDASKHVDIDHITLVYTKKPPDDHAPEKVHAALGALRDVGQRVEPIEAKLQGWGFFDGAMKGGEPSTALVALVDAPGLEHLHVDMSRALKDLGVEPSDSHVFTPHITLGYLGYHGRVDVGLPPISGRFTIDKVHVAAQDHHEVRLEGESLGRKAAEFAMNPNALRKQRQDVPGKGETSPVVGAAPLQGGAAR